MQSIRVPIQYNPYPKQKKFHQDRYKVRFRGLFGGTGSGKTMAGIFEDLSWGLENPGSVGIVFEPTYDMIRRISIHQNLEDKRFLGNPLDAHPLVHSFSRTELKLELKCPEPNGDKVSTIYFISLDKPEAAEGQSIDWAHVDEAWLVPKFQESWESIMRRLRGSSTCVTQNVGAWVTSTPDYPGSYMQKFFEDPRTKDPESASYHLSLFDNFHVDPSYGAFIVRNFTGSKAERFVNGKFALAGNLTFQFDPAIHQIHKLPTKERFKEMAYGVDWGWTNPTCILALGFDGDGRAYVVEEFYKKNVPTKDLIGKAKGMISRWGDGIFYCDPTSPESINRFYTEGLRTRKNEIKKQDGIREIGSRLLVAGDGKPRLYIFSGCKNLISEIVRYEETIKKDDHGVDALRYGLSRTKVSDKDGWVFGGW